MLGPPSFPAANSQQRIKSSNVNDDVSSSKLSVSLSPEDGKKEGRTKVALKPGRSLMDWIRLANSGKDIKEFHGGHRMGITKEELSKHNKVNDCWMAIRGKQNNIFIILSILTGVSPLFQQPIVPTARYSDIPLFRQPVLIPTFSYSWRFLCCFLFQFVKGI